MIVLGIETSCDETAAAISSNGKILSSVISTQAIHSRYGGVVPELASREHERLLNEVVDKSLNDGGISLDELEAIAVTRGPGLAGTLLTGVCFSKGLSQGLQIPMIGVNHLEAHIFANFLADPALEFPFVCLLVSGGHTQLWHVKSLGQYEFLGETRDDAAGEAFDKGARIMDLGYPGGPKIEKLAKEGDPKAISFPRALLKKGNLEFSFSGLKTSLLYFMDSFKPNEPHTLADIAASYQQAILDVLVEKLFGGVKLTEVKSCVIAGGVAANKSLRKLAINRMPETRIIFPDLAHCTDNAAMIAFLGELYLKEGKSSLPDFSIEPNLRLK